MLGCAADYFYQMSAPESQIPEYAAVIIELLKGPLYDDHKLWNVLLTCYPPIADYLKIIGIDVYCDQKEGFAFLTQQDTAATGLPRLTSRLPLSYEVTVLCVVLRDSLEEFDISNTESRRHFLTRKQIKEALELFFKDKTNQVRLYKDFDKYIKQVVELGFLKIVHEDKQKPDDTRYEVRRILKAKINNEKLEEFRQLYAQEVEKKSQP